MIFEKLGGGKMARPLRAIMEIVVLTFVIQLFIAPIVAYNFGIISFIAPIANLLVLWTLPFVLSLLIAGIIISGIAPIIQGGIEFIFYPAKLFLSYILWIGETINNTPFSFWKIENIEPVWIVVYYIVLMLILLGIRRSAHLE
jgi:hypothetical protein